MHNAENLIISFNAFLSSKPLLCVIKVLHYPPSTYFSKLIFIITSNSRLSYYQFANGSWASFQYTVSCFYAKKRQLYSVPLPYHCLLYFHCPTWLPSFNIHLGNYLHPQKYIWLLLPALGHEKLTAKECKWFQMISSTFFSPEWANFWGSRKGLLSSVLTRPDICWDDQQWLWFLGVMATTVDSVFDPPGLMVCIVHATFYFRDSVL